MKDKFMPTWKAHVFVVKYEVHRFNGRTVVRKDAYEIKHCVKNSKNYTMWEKCVKNVIASNFRKRWHDPLYMNDYFYRGMHIISIESIL